MSVINIISEENPILVGVIIDDNKEEIPKLMTLLWYIGESQKTFKYQVMALLYKYFIGILLFFLNFLNLHMSEFLSMIIFSNNFQSSAVYQKKSFVFLCSMVPLCKERIHLAL